MQSNAVEVVNGYAVARATHRIAEVEHRSQVRAHDRPPVSAVEVGMFFAAMAFALAAASLAIRPRREPTWG